MNLCTSMYDDDDNNQGSIEKIDKFFLVLVSRVSSKINKKKELVRKKFVWTMRRRRREHH